MRPPFGYEAQSYIRAAQPVDNSVEVDLTDLADNQEDVITQPYTPFDRARLDILSSYDADEDTLPSHAFEPEPSHWKGAVTGFAQSWGISLLAAAIILALAFESSCSR